MSNEAAYRVLLAALQSVQGTVTKWGYAREYVRFSEERSKGGYILFFGRILPDFLDVNSCRRKGECGSNPSSRA